MDIEVTPEMLAFNIDIHVYISTYICLFAHSYVIGIDHYLPVQPTSRPQNLKAVSTPKALLELRF